jgi:acyl dehydratase
MKVGDIVTWERTFTEDDIRLFNQVSGDQGSHHVTPDDLNFIAREMKFQFHRPVFAGDTITCLVTVVEFEPTEQYTSVRTDFVCRNQQGKEVMSGYAQGVIRQLR